MNTKTILVFRKPLLLIVWLLAMQGASFAQNLRETFSSPNGKIEWKAEGEENKVKVFEVAIAKPVKEIRKARCFISLVMV